MEPKTYSGKKKVAKRYDATERWVDLASRDGRLPKPVYFGTRFPRWDNAELDAADRRAMAKSPKAKATA